MLRRGRPWKFAWGRYAKYQLSYIAECETNDGSAWKMIDADYDHLDRSVYL